MQNTIGGQSRPTPPQLRGTNPFLHSTEQAYFMEVASFDNLKPRNWMPGPDGVAPVSWLTSASAAR